MPLRLLVDDRAHTSSEAGYDSSNLTGIFKVCCPPNACFRGSCGDPCRIGCCNNWDHCRFCTTTTVSLNAWVILWLIGGRLNMRMQTLQYTASHPCLKSPPRFHFPTPRQRLSNAGTLSSLTPYGTQACTHIPASQNFNTKISPSTSRPPSLPCDTCHLLHQKRISNQSSNRHRSDF